YGHRDVWDFAFATSGYSGAGLFPPYSPWTTSITSTGAQDMARLSSFIRSIAWQKLVPSGAGAPVIGRGLGPGNDTRTGGRRPGVGWDGAPRLCAVWRRPVLHRGPAIDVGRGARAVVGSDERRLHQRGNDPEHGDPGSDHARDQQRGRPRLAARPRRDGSGSL